MKPIFKEEKEFLEESLGIELPMYCWISGMFIHLDHDIQEYIIRYRVVDGKMTLINNKIIEIREDETVIQFNRGEAKTLPLKTWEDEYQEYREDINTRASESFNWTKDYLVKHPNHAIRLSDSGGKDSLLTKHFAHKVLDDLGIGDYVVDYFNTTNEVACTYKQIKKHNDKDKLIITSPEKGWYKWLAEDKNYFVPTAFVRSCCDKFKKLQLKDILDKDKKYVLLLGMRKHESNKRSSYEFDLNEAMGEKSNVPQNWKRILPIVEWTDAEVWLYIVHNRLDFNPLYKLGFGRVGCIICPFSSNYNDLLIQKYFPTHWERWKVMLKKNYEIYGVANRLKWTLEEWYNGMWKTGTSKEYGIMTKKATPKRVTELAELKGISEELAEKYFQRVCYKCDKKLNPGEVSMNLKTYGRHINPLKMECKKHYCETNGIKGKQYTELFTDFVNSDCDLF